VEVVKIMAQDTLEQQLYEARLKARRDADSLRVESFQEGKREGKLEGKMDMLQTYLNVRFGTSSAGIVPRLRQIQEPGLLAEIQRAIFVANSVQEIEELLTKHQVS
jgi:hypothetical protein